MSGDAIRSVRILERALADIVDHAIADAPLECCGLLVGNDAIVVGAYRTRNALASATRYLIDPADHFAVLRAARAQGLRVVGGYHSHPAGPAHPSARDIRESPADDWLHAIASRATGDGFVVSGFYVTRGNFSRVIFVTER